MKTSLCSRVNKMGKIDETNAEMCALQGPLESNSSLGSEDHLQGKIYNFLLPTAFLYRFGIKLDKTLFSYRFSY